MSRIHPLLTRFCFALSVIISSTFSLCAGDWPNIHGPNRDNHAPDTGLDWNWGKDGPPSAWKWDIGAGFAGVAVAEGQVFLFHRIEHNEVLTALDAVTGKEKWKYTARTDYTDDFGFDDGPRSVPVVVGERVLALGANGDLHVVESKSGKKLWHRKLRTEYQAPKGYFGFAAGPIVLEKRVIINVGGRGAGLVAFHLETGLEAWKATNDPAGYSSPTSIELAGKTHGVFFTRSGLVVVEAANGAVKYTLPWRARLDASVNASAPVVRKDEIFLTSSYSTGAIVLKAKGTEFEEVWSGDRSLSCHYNTPVLVGDYLYGVDGRQEGGSARLRCIDWKTGDVKWNVDRFGVASLIAVDNGLLAITETGELVRFAADPKAFKEIARTKVLDGVVRAAPALADGRLYLRDEKRLICVQLKK